MTVSMAPESIRSGSMETSPTTAGAGQPRPLGAQDPTDAQAGLGVVGDARHQLGGAGAGTDQHGVATEEPLGAPVAHERVGPDAPEHDQTSDRARPRPCTGAPGRRRPAPGRPPDRRADEDPRDVVQRREAQAVPVEAHDGEARQDDHGPEGRGRPGRADHGVGHREREHVGTHADSGFDGRTAETQQGYPPSATLQPRDGVAGTDVKGCAVSHGQIRDLGHGQAQLYMCAHYHVPPGTFRRRVVVPTSGPRHTAHKARCHPFVILVSRRQVGLPNTWEIAEFLARRGSGHGRRQASETPPNEGVQRGPRGPACAFEHRRRTRVRHPPWGRKRATNHFSPSGDQAPRLRAGARRRELGGLAHPAPGPVVRRRAPAGAVRQSHRRELGVDLELAEYGLHLGADGRLRDEAAASDLADLPPAISSASTSPSRVVSRANRALISRSNCPPSRHRASRRSRSCLAIAGSPSRSRISVSRICSSGNDFDRTVFGPRRQSGADLHRIGVAGHDDDVRAGRQADEQVEAVAGVTEVEVEQDDVRLARQHLRDGQHRPWRRVREPRSARRTPGGPRRRPSPRRTGRGRRRLPLALTLMRVHPRTGPTEASSRILLRGPARRPRGPNFPRARPASTFATDSPMPSPPVGPLVPRSKISGRSSAGTPGPRR